MSARWVYKTEMLETRFCWTKLRDRLPWQRIPLRQPIECSWERMEGMGTRTRTASIMRPLPFPTQRRASTSVLGTRWLWKNCTLSRLYFVILEHTENIYRFLYNDLIVCMFSVSCGAPKKHNRKCTFIHFFNRCTRPKDWRNNTQDELSPFFMSG